MEQKEGKWCGNFTAAWYSVYIQARQVYETYRAKSKAEFELA